MIVRVLDKLFGETTQDDHAKVFLPIAFCIFLTSSTFLFFNHRSINIFGFDINISMGIIFFPVTFTIVNIMQDKYGRLFANTAVRYGFLFDALFVAISYLLSNIGSRTDYQTVYNQLPSIMISSFFFIWISNLINTIIFEKIKTYSSAFLAYFVSSSIAESAISFLSIPLMMKGNNLTKGTLPSIIFIIFYKIIITLILSTLIAMKKRRHN